jgi:imidazole glycerol phosphate synthase subunit HisF
MPTFIKAGLWKKARKPLEGELELDRLIRENVPPAKNNTKNITSLVTSDVYTLTKEDFFKTLVYTGATDITINITSSLSLVSADFFNLLQAGAGKVTIAGSGVNINHTVDVLPTTYGSNALITVFVYTSDTVIVSGNLELA